MSPQLRVLFFLLCVFNSAVQGNDDYHKSWKGTKRPNRGATADRTQFSQNAPRSYRAETNDTSPYRSEFELISLSLRPLIDGIQNDLCKRQSTAFLVALESSTLWAVQMFDASAKISEVLYNSDRYQMGHYDECLDVNVPQNPYSLRGKYCLVNLEIEPVKETCSVSQSLGGDSCQKEDELEGRKKQIYRIGICVPNKCKTSDIESFLHGYFEARLAENNMDFRIVTPKDACSMNKPQPEKLGGRYLGYAVTLLFMWIVFITILDLFQLHWKGLNGLWDQVAKLFSLYRSLKRLSHMDGNEYSSITSGIKVILVVILILYRRYQLLIEGPTKNHIEQENTFFEIGLVYDALLFLTGYIVVQKLFRELRNCNTRRTLLKLCVKIWIRLMPLYGFMILFYAAAFEDIGSGPIWSEVVSREANQCRDMWWANLSFINNYISGSKQCINQSWYLTVSVHCSFITIFLMYLRNKKAFFGLGMFSFTILMTVILFIWNDTILMERNHPTFRFEDIYIKTHNRMPAYFIGVFSALLNNQITNSKKGITRGQIVMVLSVFTLFGLVSIVTKSVSYRRDKYSEMLFAVTSSLTFSLFIACAVLASAIVNTDALKSTGLKNIVVPLDRLSCRTLLIHNVMQLYIIGTTRTAEYMNFTRTLWMGTADVLVSYVFAVFLYLIVESPVLSIMELFLFSRKNDELHRPEKS